MSEEEVIQMLRERLRIRVRSTSRYTGGINGEPLYADSWVVELILDNEVISEDSP